MATTFAVTIERHGRFWEIEIPDIEGGYTQARNLAEVDLMARDCIAAFKGIAADSFEIDLTVKLPDSVQKHLSDAQALAEQAATAQAQAQAEAQGKGEAEAAQESGAARKLKAAGLTLREIGSMLGISYQRAHQLVHGQRQQSPRTKRPRGAGPGPGT